MDFFLVIKDWARKFNVFPNQVRPSHPWQVAEQKQDRTLQVYCNLEVAVSHIGQPRYEERALRCPQDYAAKLYAIAKYMRDESSQKTVILIRKTTGALPATWVKSAAHRPAAPRLRVLREAHEADVRRHLRHRHPGAEGHGSSVRAVCVTTAESKLDFAGRVLMPVASFVAG